MNRLERLLRPETIAVIGGLQAERVALQCDRMGFPGEIWPVHPTREQIAGRACFRSVAELPGAPDAAYVAVNRQLSIGVMRDLAALGCGGAIAYASGFLEAEGEVADGAEMQRRLIDAAGAMPLVGPNCYGLVNALDGAPLWPDQHGMIRVERGVAIVAQSSNIALNLSMQARGLPIAYLLTAGNQAQTGLSELAQGALEDPRVTAVGLYIEGVADLRAFEAMAARARALRKPIVAVKAGRSAAARAATFSHTASLAGGDAAAEALLRRLGVARVDTLTQLLEALKLLHVHGPLPGAEICSMSCSGGEASVIADVAELRARRARFRPFDADQRARVKATLPDIVAVANPFDYHTFIWADLEASRATFAAALAAGFDLSMLVIDFPRADRCDDSDWEVTIRALDEAARSLGARAATVTTMAECLPERWADRLTGLGIAPLIGMDDAIAAVDAAAFIGAVWAKPAPPALLGPRLRPGAARVLSEAEAKARLRAAGLPVVEGLAAATPDAAVDAALTLGFPVALKALGVAHKTEAGAVALGLQSADAVRAEASRMAAIPRENGAGFLVERMAPPPVAELIVGATQDPAAGPTLAVGAGGVLAELLADVAVLTLPTDAAMVREALLGLRIAPLLLGWRGKPGADLDAAVGAILAVAGFVVEHAETLEELDVNPLMLYPDGALAVDALIRLRGDDP